MYIKTIGNTNIQVLYISPMLDIQPDYWAKDKKYTGYHIEPVKKPACQNVVMDGGVCYEDYTSPNR